MNLNADQTIQCIILQRPLHVKIYMHILTFIRSSTESSPDNKATAWPSAVILSTSHFAVFLVWQNIIAWPIVTTPYMFEIALNLASGVAQSTQYCPILSNDSSSFLSRIT